MQIEAPLVPLWRGLACCTLVTLAAAGRDGRMQIRGQHLSPAHSFVRSLAFKQRLRICNAYPYESALDVFIGQEKLTTAPLAYKSCGEFRPQLRVDDEINFKVDSTSAGTFTISDLPNNDAVLLMVIYRHSTLSTAVAFESHVFANLGSPQIAVLDTYRGKAQAELRIQDNAQAKAHMRSELLRFDNVVAVDPGFYDVLLRTAEGNATQVKAKSKLVAVPRESYVVIRCGAEAQVGRSYPEDLMVYPSSDPRAMDGAGSLRPFLGGLAALSLAAMSALLGMAAPAVDC